MRMNIFTEQLKRERRGFPDGAIRRFLLAQLGAQDQPAFERALFTDAELEQRVRLTEIELADDYVFGRLGAFEATQFEKHFLCSAERAKMLTASRAFCARYAGTGTPAPARAIQFRWHYRKLKFAFALILAALLVGTFWLIIKKEPQIKREIVRRLMPKRAASQPAPVETHHPTNASAPQHRETAQPLPEHGAVTPGVAIVLRPNNRETAPLISSALEGNDSINFELLANEALASQYTVEIVTAQGQSIYASTGQTGSASAVTFAVPRALLYPGEFEIRLHDERSNVTVATYYFRVE